jgi:DNA mismatch repair ATPase MutS
LIFTTDPQTQKDLDLFYPVGNSFYDLFIKHCQTVGGRNRVYQMLSNPLNDLAAINERNHSILFIKKVEKPPIFKNYKLELIQEYLQLTSMISKPNFIDTNIQKLKLLYANSKEYNAIHEGIKSLIEIIFELDRFFNGIISTNIPITIQQLQSKWSKIQSELSAATLLQLFYGKRKGILKVKDVFRLDATFRLKKHVLKDLVNSVFELDAFFGVSKKLNENFTFPILANTFTHFNLQNHFHPLLKVAKTNTLQLSNGVAVLTGANMTGKSTLLKSIGICVLLAQVGFPVPASKMECNIFDGILTSINLSDNLQLGESFYLNEVKRIKKIIDLVKSGKRLIVFLDEIFRGTNIDESIALGKRVIDKLRNYSNCIFIISTHFHSLLKDYESVNDVEFLKMGVHYSNDTFTFTYQVEMGISNDFLATKIAENEGLFD